MPPKKKQPRFPQRELTPRQRELYMKRVLELREQGKKEPTPDQWLAARQRNARKAAESPAKPPTPAPAATPKPAAPKPPAPLSDADRNAYELLVAEFEKYGLKSLAPRILSLIQDGYEGSALALKLRDTDEYKRRFKANADRVKMFGPSAELSPAEYVANENAYRQALAASGLPRGFYDTNEDFQKWIAYDVSPAEVQSRVDLAREQLFQADDMYRNGLRSLGWSEGDMLAAILDPTKAVPLVQNNMARAQAAGSAQAYGLSLSGGALTDVVATGATRGQINAGMLQAADGSVDYRRLGAIYGEQTSDDDLVDSVFGTSGAQAANVKKKGLASKERASFGGSSGLSQGSLSSRRSGTI